MRRISHANNQLCGRNRCRKLYPGARPLPTLSDDKSKELLIFSKMPAHAETSCVVSAYITNKTLHATFQQSRAI